MVGARRAGRLGAGAGGRDVLAAGARALGLLHRLRQTTHASSPEMRLCERRAGDCAGRGRRRRGARGDAQRAGNDHRASPGPRKPRDASPRRRLDGHGLGGHDANRRDRRRSGRGVAGAGRGSGRARWTAQGCLLVGCAARPTNTLTEPIFAFSLSPHPLLSPKKPSALSRGQWESARCPPIPRRPTAPRRTGRSEPTAARVPRAP